MNDSALFMLILIGVLVWGGFLVALWYAMKLEKNKK